MSPSLSDKDECSSVDNVCAHGSCANTEGGFKCTCEEGFVEHADGTSCIGKWLSDLLCYSALKKIASKNEVLLRKNKEHIGRRIADKTEYALDFYLCDANSK